MKTICFVYEQRKLARFTLINRISKLLKYFFVCVEIDFEVLNTSLFQIWSDFINAIIHMKLIKGNSNS